jgi:site-specific DNA recombinase
MGTWDRQTIQELLTRETYVGRWAYKKTRQMPLPGSDASRTVPAPREEWLWVSVPAIIDEDLFAAAQDRAKHNAVMAQRNRKFTYLFSGMVSCLMFRLVFGAKPSSIPWLDRSWTHVHV